MPADSKYHYHVPLVAASWRAGGFLAGFATVGALSASGATRPTFVWGEVII